MTVYVDNMHRYARVDRGSGRVVTGRWSHLLADDSAELAGFAARLGLRPEWIQFPSTAREHYDVVEAVRRRAVAAGAIPISYPRGTANLITTKRLQASALDAANRGWQVFPLRPGTKTPAIRDWEHQTSTDPERIRELWTAQLQHGGWHVPEPLNAGIACGPSGLVVIDLDVEKPGQDRANWPEQWLNRDIASGVDVLAALADQAGHTVPETYTVATASGGRHLYFTAPASVRLRNSTGRLGPMIDVRGEGGYVVADGSRLHRRSGRDDSPGESSELAYRLVDDHAPAELPGWLTAAIAADQRRDHNTTGGHPQIEDNRYRAPDGRSEGYGAAALRGEVGRLRSAPVGQRNHTLNAAAYSLGQLIAAGALDQDRAVDALTAAAESAGLERAEIAATITSGLTAGARRPRAIPVHHVTARAAEPGESDRAGRTEPDRTDDPPMTRDTATDALQPAPAVPEAPTSGNGSVAGEEVDHPTDAADAAQEASNMPPSEPPGQAEPGEAPSNGPRQGESLRSKARPAAVPEEPPDGHAALDEAIKHARAAVAPLEASRAATRHQSAADSPDAAIQTGRPGYWAEPEVDL